MLKYNFEINEWVFTTNEPVPIMGDRSLQKGWGCVTGRKNRSSSYRFTQANQRTVRQFWTGLPSGAWYRYVPWGTGSWGNKHHRFLVSCYRAPLVLVPVPHTLVLYFLVLLS